MIEYYKIKTLDSLFYINDEGLVCYEEWKDVINYEGLYQVSNLGRVKILFKIDFSGRKRKEQIMSLCNGKGYRISSFSKNNIAENFKAHRLVAIHFIQNPNNLPEVNHKNGIKSDNRVDNLEWCTSKQNIRHGLDTGIIKRPKGEKNGMSKITEKQVLEIREIGKTLTLLEISKIYGISFQTVSGILNKKSWKWL